MHTQYLSVSSDLAFQRPFLLEPCYINILLLLQFVSQMQKLFQD